MPQRLSLVQDPKQGKDTSDITNWKTLVTACEALRERERKCKKQKIYKNIDVQLALVMNCVHKPLGESRRGEVSVSDKTQARKQPVRSKNGELK